MKNIFLIAASFLAGIAFRHGIQIDKDRISRKWRLSQRHASSRPTDDLLG